MATNGSQIFLEKVMIHIDKKVNHHCKIGQIVLIINITNLLLTAGS